MGKSRSEEQRTNVCFNCGGKVPQVGPAQTVVVAICKECKPKYMQRFNMCIEIGMDWREDHYENY